MEGVQTLTEDELNEIYNWVDEIPLSRPKKNIARDFADGVLMAEIIYYYFPKIIEIHNYSQAHSLTQKSYNWNTLNQKVFRKMGFQLSSTDIDNVINAKPESIERILKLVRVKMEKYMQKLKENPEPYGSPKRIPGVSTKVQAQPSMGQEYQKQPQQQKGYRVDDEKELSKDRTIQELKETIEILELKIKKLEQLTSLKDSKIQALQAKLAQHGLI